MFAFNFTYPVTPSQCFACIFGMLDHEVAEHAPSRGLPAWLVSIICTRIRRLGDRLAVLLARNSSAHPPIPRTPPAQVPARPSRRRAPARTPALRNFVPQNRGWLYRLLRDTPARVSHEACQLRYLVADPDILPLLTADPAIGRILRALAYMLDIPLPEALRRPIRQRPAAPAPPPIVEPDPIAKPAPTLFAPQSAATPARQPWSSAPAGATKFHT